MTDMKKIKNIAVIAFESKKTDLIEWSYFNKEILASHEVSAPVFEGNVLEGTLNKKINRLEARQLGGYRQVCKLITENKIDAVIIFGDAEDIFEAKDLNAIIRAAVEHDIIVATNRTTADFVLNSSLLNEDYITHASQKKTQLNKRFTEIDTPVQLAKAS
jgi:methylglyoxal synthase